MKKWYIIDAEGKTLGRLAAAIAPILRGKHKPDFMPNRDGGDYIIVTNADKFTVSGNKMDDKIYYRHSGYSGGLKETKLKHLLEKKPTLPLEKAVSGMIPQNRLKDDIMKKLKLYTGSEHPHTAQTPEPLSI